MTPQQLIKRNKELHAVAEDEHLHLLDRIDAYLELSELHRFSAHDRAMYVTRARRLIQQEQFG